MDNIRVPQLGDLRRSIIPCARAHSWVTWLSRVENCHLTVQTRTHPRAREPETKAARIWVWRHIVTVQDVFWTWNLMMLWWMMLRKVISIIIISLIPVDIHLFFGASVSQPIPSHIPCFWSTLPDIILNEAVRSGVICFDASRGLRMTEGFQNSS